MVKSKKKDKDTGPSLYALLGWSIAGGTFAAIFFLPWIVNDIFISQWWWIWVLPTLAICAVAFGALRRDNYGNMKYHYMSLVSWALLATILILAIYASDLWSTTFDAWQKPFGI